MAKHQPDLVMCMKQPGIAIGRLCEKCDGKCVMCDSYVRPCTLVRICDECNYGAQEGRCVICGGVGVSDAYYCKECTLLEKDRDGCPKIVTPIQLEVQRAHVAELSSDALTAESLTPEAAASFFHFITCDDLESLVKGWVTRYPWLAKLLDSGARAPVAVASPGIKVGRKKQH